MAGYLNKVMLIGNLGADPEIRALQNGNKVANLNLATTESWKDKATGERKERTEWHRIVIWTEGLVSVVEKYLSKGDKIMIEGQLQTRKWEKDGQDHYSTEIVLQGFNASMIMLSTKRDGDDDRGGGRQSDNRSASSGRPRSNAPAFESGGMDDDIPF